MCNRKPSFGYLRTNTVSSFRMLTEFVLADRTTICQEGCQAVLKVYSHPFLPTLKLRSVQLYAVNRSSLHYSQRPHHARADSDSFCLPAIFSSWSIRQRTKHHSQKGDGEKSHPAFASKGGEGTKHSFLTVTVFSAR